jgi:hypothetical protein
MRRLTKVTPEDFIPTTWIDEDFDVVEYEDTKFEAELAEQYDDNEYIDEEGQEYFEWRKV